MKKIENFPEEVLRNQLGTTFISSSPCVTLNVHPTFFKITLLEINSKVCIFQLNSFQYRRKSDSDYLLELLIKITEYCHGNIAMTYKSNVCCESAQKTISEFLSSSVILMLVIDVPNTMWKNLAPVSGKYLRFCSHQRKWSMVYPWFVDPFPWLWKNSRHDAPWIMDVSCTNDQWLYMSCKTEIYARKH